MKNKDITQVTGKGNLMGLCNTCGTPVFRNKLNPDEPEFNCRCRSSFKALN